MSKAVIMWKNRILKEWSIRKKIFAGYLVIIMVMLSAALILFTVLWEQLNKKSIEKSLLSSNYSVKKTIDNYFDNMIKLSEYPYFNEDIISFLEKDYSLFGEDEKILEQINDIREINAKIYKHIYYMHNQVDSVHIYPENMERYAYCSIKSVVNYNVKQENWFETVKNGKGKPYIVGVHKSKSVAEEWYVISVARAIMDSKTGDYMGMIVIDCSVEKFASMWETSQKDGNMIVVSDKNGNLISDDPELETSSFSEMIQKHEGKTDTMHRVSYGSQSWYMMETNLTYMQGKIYQMIPITGILQNLTAVMSAVILVAVILGALLILFSAKISDTITQPIAYLVKKMETVETGDFSIEPEDFNGELKVLAETFYEMVEQISQMFDEVKVKEKEKRKMEMLALQAQISPHFLYNTLNSAVWLAELQGADKVSEMLDSLIKVLNYLADDTGEFVSVRRETDFIKSYIRILNFRYFERFTFHLNLQDEAMDCLMLRFILQPIVENAVLHGFDQDDMYANVEISVRLEEQHLIIMVIDDGKGISEDRIQEILNKQYDDRKGLNKIGIYNVNQRLKLTYGEEYAVQIESRLKSYTKVIVKIPVEK